jgi:hypothetical protein
MSNQQPESPPLESYEESGGGSSGTALVVASNTNIEVRDGIITAQRVAMPRSLAHIMTNLKTMAAAAGTDWYYRWKVKKKGGSEEWVEGPSVKCATAVARMYGNCQVNCRVTETPTHWQFMARFVDYETGFSLERPYQQRKSQSTGRMEADRALDLAFQIGTSKATRNVICNALETFTDFAFEQAKASLVEAIGKNLVGSRTKLLSQFSELGIDVKRVERVYGKTSEQWLAPDIAKMVAEVRSIIDGMGSKEEFYPATPEEIEANIQKATGDSSNTGEPATAEQQSEEVETLIVGLEQCKTQADVTKYISENEAALAYISGKASRAVQLKWSEAFSKKMGSFKKASS